MEDDATAKYLPARDIVLYAVDGSLGMQNYLTKSLDGIASAIKANLLAQPEHEAGVIIYNLADPSNQKTSKTDVILSLGRPSSADIKFLLRLVDDISFRDQRLVPAPRRDPAALSAMLTVALRQFNAVAGSQNTIRSFRALVVLTCDDSPVDTDTIQSTLTRANDLVNASVVLRPIFIGDSFDVRNFWEEVRFTQFDPADSADRDKAITEEHLERNIVQDPSELPFVVLARGRRKYTAFRASLILHSVEMSIVGYNVISARAAPRSYKVYAEGDREYLVETETVFFEKASGLELSQDKLARAYLIGKEDVIDVDYEEDITKFVRSFETKPTLRILGFRPGRPVLPRGSVSHSVLIVPRNFPLKNSTHGFAALRRVLLARGISAVASYAPRVGQAPRLAYVYADEEQHGALWLVPLPYVDEQRTRPRLEPSVSLQDLNNVSEGVEALINVSSHWNSYDPRRFSDWRAEHQDRVREATALSTDLSTMNTVVDSTLPHYDNLVNSDAVTSAANALHTLIDTLDIADDRDKILPPVKAVGSKQKRPVEEFDMQSLQRAAVAGSFNRYTVKDLKAIATMLRTDLKDEKDPDLQRALNHLSPQPAKQGLISAVENVVERYFTLYPDQDNDFVNSVKHRRSS